MPVGTAGGLLDVNQATLRKWVEYAGRAEGNSAPLAATHSSDPEEVCALKKRIAVLERGRDPQDRVDVYRPGGARPPTQVIVSHDGIYRGRIGVEPICTVLSEHEISISPSTCYARKAHPVTTATLEEAYLVNAPVPLLPGELEVYGQAFARRSPRGPGGWGTMSVG